MARDLRITTTAMKMITDMERIADQAVDISEIARHLLSCGVDAPQAISPMATKAVTMVNKSIDAFIRRDLALAEEIIDADDEVDALFLKIRGEIVDTIRQGTTAGSAAIDYIMVAKYLERIADHAANLAESVRGSLFICPFLPRAAVVFAFMLLLPHILQPVLPF
ncbi:hypothetical protein LJC27_06180 [Christensenellaceae bacterium OttesenSCG-928-M15]|nr:hypothetical protein [Christensenellaceae bacterium OttesenSCG-928-M15]